MLQYRHVLLALPPPNPPPPPGSSTLLPSSLVSGYDSDPEAEEVEVPAETIEADPEFIGPRVPRVETDPPPPGAEDQNPDQNKEIAEDEIESVSHIQNGDSVGNYYRNL